MAGTDGKSSSDLTKDLLAQGHRYSFFQALRLLSLLQTTGDPTRNAGEGEALKGVTIRPQLTLGFPASDIANIERLPDDRFLITAAFLGIYGTSSPLPAFYTEDLLQERREDLSVTRDFLDIFNHRLFSLLFEGWKKYRPLIQIVEQKNRNDIERLCALSGMSSPDARAENMQAVYPLLRYTGIFNQHPRSSLGLETVLTDYLRGPGVEVLSCVPRQVTIPQDQKLCLGGNGSVLGVDSFLGDEVMDFQGKFRVCIGPLRRERFQGLLQGGPEHQKITQVIDMFLTDPLEYDFELTLIEGETKHACLGATEWSRLGLDTVIFTGDSIGEVKVLFPPEEVKI